MKRLLVAIACVLGLLLSPSVTIIGHADQLTVGQAETKRYEGRIVNHLPYLVKVAIDSRETGEQVYSGELQPNEVVTIYLPEGEFDIYLTAFSEAGEQVAGDHFLFIIMNDSVPSPYYPFEIQIGR